MRLNARGNQGFIPELDFQMVHFKPNRYFNVTDFVFQLKSNLRTNRFFGGKLFVLYQNMSRVSRVVYGAFPDLLEFLFEIRTPANVTFSGMCFDVQS